MDGSKGKYHVSDKQGDEDSIQVLGCWCTVHVFSDDIQEREAVLCF